MQCKSVSLFCIAYSFFMQVCDKRIIIMMELQHKKNKLEMYLLKGAEPASTASSTSI